MCDMISHNRKHVENWKQLRIMTRRQMVDMSLLRHFDIVFNEMNRSYQLPYLLPRRDMLIFCKVFLFSTFGPDVLIFMSHVGLFILQFIVYDPFKITMPREYADYNCKYAPTA